jgi:hypothetical protein
MGYVQWTLTSENLRFDGMAACASIYLLQIVVTFDNIYLVTKSKMIT